ncbi:MAG: helicase-related protein, partial [Oscillospiraceae bacterium]
DRNKFRVRGDVVEVLPAYSSTVALRIEFWGDTVDRVSEVDPTTGKTISTIDHIAIYPATHYIIPRDILHERLGVLRKEMMERADWFTKQGKLIEAERIVQRTQYDLEMLDEIGFCKGIENYSPVLSGREPGAEPFTLLDYFPDDYLMFIDESHVMLPQLHGMYGGDYQRKKNLVDYGFRLPSAYDNRPLKFDEFYRKINQVIYSSATPGEFEREKSTQVVEQIIRPTGLLDPEVTVKPTENQIDDLVSEIHVQLERGEKTLITTLTKKMAEDLTDYLADQGIKVRYMHYDVDTIERMKIIRDLRMGEFDVLVGINLLREGLDIPEVSLVAILDADQEGFLRSETSLIQTIGRAARNTHGRVIMYADTVTPSMENAIRETYRRRTIQSRYNEEHGIVPKTIVKEVRDIIDITHKDKGEDKEKYLSPRERAELIEKLTAEMKQAAKMLEFEYAADLRDKIERLKKKQHG